jgi:hypothetical protein
MMATITVMSVIGLTKKDFLVVGKVHDGLGDSDVRGGLDADISVMFEK